MVAPAKVHGGIITDQMLTGSIKYYKIGGVDFGYVLSDNTVNLDTKVSGGNEGSVITYYFVVADGVSVPDSSAELALRVILEKCTIIQIGLTGSPRTSTIHIACENTSNGWEDAAEMQTAIRELGTITVPTTVGSEDQHATPVSEEIDMSTVVVTEVSFELA